MFDFFANLFGRPSSSQTAKERLRLVLLSDHLSLAPDVVESLKHDLVEVISRYVEVDIANCDVTFEQQDHQVAMLANIPILSMKARPAPPAPPPPAREEPEPVTSVQAAMDLQPAATPTRDDRPATGGTGSRRKRRKRARMQGAAAPQPG